MCAYVAIVFFFIFQSQGRDKGGMIEYLLIIVLSLQG
jgi:hypothetical protein